MTAATHQCKILPFLYSINVESADRVIYSYRVFMQKKYANLPLFFFPSHAASSYGHVNLLKYLITCGADVNLRDFDGDTPLHVCETREVAQILIDSGADTRALNGAGQSIFETALQEENHDMVEFLAEKGLNFMNNISFTTHTMETLEEEESDGDDG